MHPGKTGIAKEQLSDPNLTPPRATRAPTDEALVASWFSTFDPGDSAGTLVLYRRVQGRFFTWLSARGLTLRTLKVEDLAEWRRVLEGAPATRATAMSVIKSLLGYAHRTGYLPLNVAAAVKPPKVAPDPDARTLSQGQVKAMIHAARNALLQEELRLRPRPRYMTAARLRLNLVLWAYYSGCRVTEIAQAQWEDLHPRMDGDFSLSVLGKGRKRRTIPIPRHIVEQIADDDLRRRSGRIFPIGARRIQTIIKALAEEAGLEPGVSPHWLRHSHASHAVDRGAPLHVVQGSLGHASLATTGRYLHRAQRGAAEYLCAF